MMDLRKMADLADQAAHDIREREIKDITDKIPRLIEEASAKGSRQTIVFEAYETFDFDCPLWHAFLYILGKHENGDCLAKDSLAKSVFDYCKKEGLRPRVNCREYGTASSYSNIIIYW